MRITVEFPGGLKADAAFGDFVVKTDQSVKDGGEGSAPSPFSLFLTSIGTCAGTFVLSFCKNRDLSIEGIRILQDSVYDPATHRWTEVNLTIEVPPTFPEKYHDALVRSAEQCAVRRAIQNPPVFTTKTRVVGTKE